MCHIVECIENVYVVKQLYSNKNFFKKACVWL